MSFSVSIPIIWAVPVPWVELIMTFIVDVLDAIAWPGAIAFVLVKLRGEIGTAITQLLGKRLKRLQAVGVTAEFSPQPQDADAETEEAVEVAERALPALPPQVENIVRDARERTESDEEASSLLGLQLYFERVHRIIYRSQMELLQHLADLNRGAGPIDVAIHHGLHEQRANDYAFDEDTWLTFLYNAGLVDGDRTQNTLRITTLGNWYLMYCRAVGYPPRGRVW